jgi:hypothetical protein
LTLVPAPSRLPSERPAGRKVAERDFLFFVIFENAPSRFVSRPFFGVQFLHKGVHFNGT